MSMYLNYSIFGRETIGHLYLLLGLLKTYTGSFKSIKVLILAQGYFEFWSRDFAYNIRGTLGWFVIYELWRLSAYMLECL